MNNRLFLSATAYMIFIAVGLPNGLLGAAWPNISEEMGLPLEYLGYITSVMAIMGIVAGIVSVRLMKKVGAGLTIFLAVFLYSCTIAGVPTTNSLFSLYAVFIPFGFTRFILGSGINSFVSVHYEPKNQNFLQACWGVGALIGPIIMTRSIAGGIGWRGCFFIVAGVGIVAAVFAVICMITHAWEKVGADANKAFPKIDPLNPLETHSSDSLPHSSQVNKLYKNNDKLLTLFLCFCYSGAESSLCAFLTSYMYDRFELSLSESNIAVTLYLAGLTVGRVLAGLVSRRVGNMKLFRMGIIFAVAGLVVAFLSPFEILTDGGVMLTGIGFGPLFPATIYETHNRFSNDVSSHLVGYQVSASQAGSTTLPLVTGFILSNISTNMLFPIAALCCTAMFIVNEALIRRLDSCQFYRQL